MLLASHGGNQRSAGCTLSYGDERGDRGMFSCLSEPPHRHHHHLLLLLLHNHHHSPLILMLTHSQALSRHFETPQTNSPIGGVRRGRGGWLTASRRRCRAHSCGATQTVCVACPLLLSAISSVNKATSDSLHTCFALQIIQSRLFAFSLDKGRIKQTTNCRRLNVTQRNAALDS